MSKPKISIIIPVYNTQDYVKEAVGSIIAQSLSDIEIILINDGSTDNSLATLNELAKTDSRIKLINQENRGLSISRNIGLNHATGEFIYFMDSDDLLDTDALELCYNECIKENLDFIFFDAESFNDLNEKINWFSYKRTDHLINKVYSGLEIFNMQVKQHLFRSSVCLNVIKKSFLEDNNINFYPNIIHEDQLFSVYIYLTAQRVGFIKRAFFKRRVRENSIMTTKYNWKNIEGYFTVAHQLIFFSAKKNNDKKESINTFLTQMLNAAIWQGHTLPLGQRLRLFFLSLKQFKKYIHKKTLISLLLKSFSSKTKKN